MLTSFDGGRLFGQVHGSGAPEVVALHGWRRDHRDYDVALGGRAAITDVANAAIVPSDGGRTQRSPADLELPGSPLASIALDLPGFGGTPPPDEAWGSPEYARALGPLLDEIGEPVVVVGHSFGGRIGVQLAAQRPRQVRGLVLTGAPLFPANPAPAGRRPTGPPLQLRLARALGRRRLVSEERLERVRRRYGSADYRAATGVMRDILVKAIAEEREEAYTGPLRQLSCPVELVWGELDSAAPPRVAERISTSVTPTPRLTVVPGVGHLTPLLVPGQLRAAVDRLLDAP